MSSLHKLSDTRYLYFLADGIYNPVRQDDHLCLLLIIDLTEHGLKELVAVGDDYRKL
ncbi:MAG: hypothetical protein ACTS73_05970 [Arsenophonus sp. NEOnobi-MAG3]